MTRISILILLLSALVVSCASNGTKPDDMSAEAHREAAAKQQSEADEHAQHHDAAAAPVPNRKGIDASVDDLSYGVDFYNPAGTHAAFSESHRELAAAHLAAANNLEAFEEAQCKAFPASTRVACPLLGNVELTSPIAGGVRLQLVDSVKQEAVIAHIQCHLAFGRAQGREGMDHCPLYIEDVQVSKGTGFVELTTSNAAAVAELRTRAESHATGQH